MFVKIFYVHIKKLFFVRFRLLCSVSGNSFAGNIPISFLFHSLNLLNMFSTECHIYATLALIPLTEHRNELQLYTWTAGYIACDIFDRPQVQILFNWVKRPYNNVEYKNQITSISICFLQVSSNFEGVRYMPNLLSHIVYDTQHFVVYGNSSINICYYRIMVQPL